MIITKLTLPNLATAVLIRLKHLPARVLVLQISVKIYKKKILLSQQVQFLQVQVLTKKPVNSTAHFSRLPSVTWRIKYVVLHTSKFTCLHVLTRSTKYTFSLKYINKSIVACWDSS